MPNLGFAVQTLAAAVGGENGLIAELSGMETTLLVSVIFALIATTLTVLTMLVVTCVSGEIGVLAGIWFLVLFTPLAVAIIWISTILLRAVW